MDTYILSVTSHKLQVFDTTSHERCVSIDKELMGTCIRSHRRQILDTTGHERTVTLTHIQDIVTLSNQTSPYIRKRI